MTRRLTLRAERLAGLTHDELASVAGGLPTNPCTGVYPTLSPSCLVLVSAVADAVREATTV